MNLVRAPAYPAEFDAFWQAYPRRVGKAAALEQWSRLPQELRNGRLTAAATAYAAAVAKWSADESRFIPHPSTWLHQGRFDDDPATWVRVKPQEKKFVI